MSDLKEARFPVLVLALTMLSPIVLAIGLVIWKLQPADFEGSKPKSTTLSDEVPEGRIRLILTVPGMMSGSVQVSRLNSEGKKSLSRPMPLKSAVGIADLDLGPLPCDLLIEAQGYEPLTLRAELKRVTATLELLTESAPESNGK